MIAAKPWATSAAGRAGAKGIVVLLSVLVSGFLLRELCIEPYRLNLRKRTLADRTETAFRLQRTNRAVAGELAAENAEQLRSLTDRFPTDPDLQVIRAANCRLLGWNAEAVDAYGRAVHYEPTPEMYLSLGTLQLQMGRTGEAQRNLQRAIEFDARFVPAVDQLYEEASRSAKP